MKKYIWGILYGILLTAFTVYVLLDTFVITKVYRTVPHGMGGTNVIEQDGNGTGSHEPVSEQPDSKSNATVDSYNGDYYGSQEKGYVLRNGVLYRDSASRNQEDLAIYSDGSFGIFEEQSISADTLLSNGAVQILSFGPAPVNIGSISLFIQKKT